MVVACWPHGFPEAICSIRQAQDADSTIAAEKSLLLFHERSRVASPDIGRLLKKH